LLNNFPFRERIKEQAGVMDVNGTDHLTGSMLDELFPVANRHGQPAFTVEIN